MLPPLDPGHLNAGTFERLRQRFGLLELGLVDIQLPGIVLSSGALEREPPLHRLGHERLAPLGAGQVVEIEVAADDRDPAYRMIVQPLPQASSRALLVCDALPAGPPAVGSGLLAMIGSLALIVALGAATVAVFRARPRGDAAVGDGSQLVAAIGGIVADLKAKERNLEQLRQADQREAQRAQLLSTSVTNYMPSAAVLLDEAGVVRLFNPAAQELFGIGADVAVGRSLEDLPLVRQVLGRPVERCLAARAPVARTETSFRRADGQERVVGLGVSPVVDADGRLEGALCLATDLSAIQSLQRQVQLRNNLASLGELSAGLAHEFKNAVSTIRGFAVLAGREARPELMREFADAIAREAEAMNGLLEDFLKFARPAALELGDVRLDELLRGCIAELAAEPGMAKVRFTLRGSFPELQADGGLLKQAFLNLLRNAVQAYAGSEREPTVELAGEVRGDRVRVAVRDSGRGIKAADRGKVFVPFFTTKERGTGMGLAIVQKIVVSHGGRVDLRSVEGEGSTFLVDLPLHPPADAA
jgi:PAS domain S-box-containing protein